MADAMSIMMQDAKREDHPLPAGFFAWPSKKAGEAIVLGETVGGSAIDLSTFFAGDK